MEKELSAGDHGYARRTPLHGMEEDEADGKAEEQQPCTQCQLLKNQLEQEMQRSARLRKEVGRLLLSLSLNQPTLFWSVCCFKDEIIDLNHMRRISTLKGLTHITVPSSLLLK